MRYLRVNRHGFTLVELLVSIAIFAIILTAIYEAFVAQMKHSTREYKLAELEMELGIAKNIIERDLAMAGHGIADNYNTATFADIVVPRVASIGAAPYTLTLTGTGLGIRSRASQTWSYVATTAPTFQVWGDVRENPIANEYVILMEPSSKRLLGEGATWKFRYTASSTNLNPTLTSPIVGTLVYGLSDVEPAQPYYTVTYALGGTPPSVCAQGTQNLLRTETVTNTTPPGDRILACVRDFQVSFGLDTNNDGTIDHWDIDGSQSGVTQFDTEQLKKAIKQIKVFILVQTSNREPGYTYPDTTVWVGDAVTGHNVTLDSTQRGYRWKLVSLIVTPRNIR